MLGLGFSLQGSGFGLRSLGIKVEGLRLRVPGLGLTLELPRKRQSSSLVSYLLAVSREFRNKSLQQFL